ncbi:ATP-binding cassette sub-family C member 10 isoform X2 [Solea solea]|uniref:ATP-binding cassette sub-family C member 10 isoform X2 n=1 Tax=Solea solea TaxID=90069 RepID=UPI00272D615B|nr:ATP-binding cassette sub-family C member 10 isoform X2 [Solea solea]
MSYFGPAELVAGLCHTDKQNPFPLWQNGHVSSCFNQLVLGALPYAGMAIFSACYLSVARCSLLQTSAPCGWTLRLVSALLALLLFTADVVLVSILQQGDMYLDVLTDSCAILAWLLHLSAITVLQKSVFRGTRGPPQLFVLVLLLVPNLVITLTIYCDSEGYLNIREPLKLARFVLASGRAFPLLVYLLAFAFPYVTDGDYTLNINTVDDGSPLISESALPDTGRVGFSWRTRRGTAAGATQQVPRFSYHQQQQAHAQAQRQPCEAHDRDPLWYSCNHVMLGHQLTAAKVFTTLALVGMLIIPLNSFPWVLNSILEAKVSLERIQSFFKLTNQDLQAYYALVSPEDAQTSVLLNQGTFSWQSPDGLDNDKEEATEPGAGKGSLLLHTLNLHIIKGSLIVVVGKVGCGKSSLLAALTGELNRRSGVVYIADRETGFGLASQEPWIQHASVRDNILFGKEYDPTFYQAVIEACALADDLNVLPKGDKTEVGENGVTLSGGQKARVALARAVYMDKDIYLLDDPLAAVDTDVAEHLMQKCIMELLRGKTRILCTHRIEFVDKADMVVLMDNGTIIKTGSPAEILPLIEAVPKKRKNDNNAKEKEQDEDESSSPSDLLVDDDADQLQAEQKQAGGLAWRVYQTYWAAVGGVLASSVLISLLLMQASKNVSDWWLSHWISELTTNGSTVPNASFTFTSAHLLLFSHGELMSPMLSAQTFPSNNMSSDVKFYLIVYGSIGMANTVFTGFRAILFAYGAICAARTIHNRLLDRVLKATVTFFDTTPLGRILNRFSSDLYSVDDSLPFILNIFLANIFGLLGMLVVISYGMPWVLVPLLPLALLYYRTQQFYRHTSRELKRLCSLTLSPVYSHFSETLTGLGTIRASASSARFVEESAKRLEQNQRCLFLSNAAMQWLDIRLQLIGVTVVTGLAMIAVIQHQFHTVDPGLVGLSLSYALSITSLLSGLIFSFTQTEMQLVSVERTEEYSTGLAIESQQQNTELPTAWPEQGWLEFRGAVLAYRDSLPNALDGVSMVVRPGEKVGIVGRTGSGKSTLFLALFRMVELNQGQILLDGLDISTVGLSQLRSRLAIIPQDPFLFSGTIRENLDPCGRHLDQQLLDVLDQCHLHSVVNRMGGLDAEVGERGKSLSVGQRQLLCLARALLTEAKVLCIDEATASVDHRTDRLLQQTIRDKFQDKTVLTIAHRINTIMDCDRVLVMHSGKAVEFDTPAALCQSDQSIFHRLVGGNGE